MQGKVCGQSEVAQSCPTLCNPVDCNLPGSSIHGILQARILERVAISFSRGSSRTRVSHIAGRRFTLWATKEVQVCGEVAYKCFLPGGARGKDPTCQCRRQTWVQSLGQEDLLEEDTATHSNILAWGIPWTEEPGRLLFIKSQSQKRLKQLSLQLCTEERAGFRATCHPLREEQDAQNSEFGEGLGHPSPLQPGVLGHSISQCLSADANQHEDANPCPLSCLGCPWSLSLGNKSQPFRLPEKNHLCPVSGGISGGASGKEPACQCRSHKRCKFASWVKKIWRMSCQPTPVFLSGESHGQRSLTGYGPQDHIKFDKKEVT